MILKDDTWKKTEISKGDGCGKENYICLKDMFLQRSCRLQVLAIGLKKG